MIDEKKLIEETQKCFVNNSIHKNDLAEVIANLPKVGKWIPCSERLPEEYGNYLVTSDEDVDIGTFTPNTAKWSGCDADGFYWVYDIIAWMPLPEPYKESEE
jgi:hypothetical protein